MSMKLIDADALKKELEEILCIEPILYQKTVFETIDNAPTVEYPFYQEAYQTGYEEGKNERLKSKCKNCDLYFKAMTKEEGNNNG